MKGTLTISLMLIALMSANSLVAARVPAQTTATAGERILADEALFTRASLADFNLDVLRSDSVKTYYPIPEMLRPTIEAIRLRYGQADAEVIEKIPVTDDREIDGDAPGLSWRELTVHYYGRVGFGVEADGGERAVLFVTNRPAPILAESLFPQAASWSQLTSGTTNELRSVHFVNENEGWTAGANATLLRTTDGGTTWSPVSNTGVNPANGFNAVRLIDQNTVWVGGRAAAIRSTNGGANWGGVQWTAATGIPFQNRLFPASAETGWGVGPGPRTHLRHRLTSSFNFTTVFNEVSPEMNDVYFIDANQGWSVGNSGKVFHIASDTLSAQTSGTTQTLNGVDMLDANTGWIVGNSGTILKTTNGGGTWTAQTSGTTTHLRDVSFVDANSGWAVGDGGTIASTSNGGTMWTTEMSGVSADLRDVHALSPSVVFAVGTNGTILKRGGATAGSDFSLSFDPAIATAQRGAKGRSTLMINRTGGFTGNVTIITPDASGIGVKVKPGEASTTDASLGFKFKVKESATVGTHELTFTGMDDTGRSRSAKVTLVIQ